MHQCYHVEQFLTHVLVEIVSQHMRFGLSQLKGACHLEQFLTTDFGIVQELVARKCLPRSTLSFTQVVDSQQSVALDQPPMSH